MRLLLVVLCPILLLVCAQARGDPRCDGSALCISIGAEPFRQLPMPNSQRDAMMRELSDTALALSAEHRCDFSLTGSGRCPGAVPFRWLTDSINANSFQPPNEDNLGSSASDPVELSGNSTAPP